MEKVVISTEETETLARELAKNLKSGAVLGLYGNLGTGKTTFTAFLVEALGIDAKVQSPSFVLARVYEGKETRGADKKGKKDDSPTLEGQRITKVNHLDLYRLQNPEDVESLGLEEYFNQENSITIIEWPEIAEGILPRDTMKIMFEDLGENKRKIYFK